MQNCLLLLMLMLVIVIETNVQRSTPNIEIRRGIARDLIRSLPIRSAFSLPVHVAASLAAPFSTSLGMTRRRRVSYPAAAITFSSIAIGVGNAVTSIVVRVGFGLAGPAKYSA